MQLDEDINPIQKRRIVVYNVGGRLKIDKEGNLVQVGEGQHEANMNNMAGGMQTVVAQFAAICQENIDLRELLTTQYDVMRDELLRLRQVIGRVANRPVMINHGFVNHQGVIQFPPKMVENWVSKLVTKNRPNWQRIVVLCVHNTTSALNS